MEDRAISVEISVVIVNYNVRDLILKCLRSIYSDINSTMAVETIVVDNGSNDGSISAIKEQFPQVIVIENNYNAGFPAANNMGFSISRGKYILMLNPDTEIVGEALKKLKVFLDSNQQVGLVAPELLNSDGSHQISTWRFPKMPYIAMENCYLNRFIPSKYYKECDYNKSFEVESVSGAAMMFNRELLDLIGNLDERLFWIEDIDYCYRIWKTGKKIVYLPDAKIFHYIGQSAKKNYTVSISNQTFNKIKFYQIHHGVFLSYIVKIMSFINVFIRLVVFCLLSPLNVIYIKKAKAYFYTIFRVFNPPMGLNDKSK